MLDTIDYYTPNAHSHFFVYTQGFAVPRRPEPENFSGSEWDAFDARSHM
jgi:hypothetical protein